MAQNHENIHNFSSDRLAPPHDGGHHRGCQTPCDAPHDGACNQPITVNKLQTLISIHLHHRGHQTPPMMPPIVGTSDAPCDAPMIGGATYHCKPTSNIDIYPSSSGGVGHPHYTPIVGVLDAPCDASHELGATYHCKPTSNIDIYPSTSWWCIAPMIPPSWGCQTPP